MRLPRRRSRERGQALAEFALVIPVFFLLLFGFIDVARYVYTTTGYGQAAREAARYGSVEQWSFSCPASVVTPTRENCTEAVAMSRVPAGAPVPAASGVVYSCSGTCRAGDLLTVTVSGPFNAFTPVISEIIKVGGTAPIVSQASTVVIQ